MRSRDHAPGDGVARPQEARTDSAKALYDPASGKVGCVLLQAAYQGDGRVCRIFGAEEWFLAPTATMGFVTAPLSQWELVAKLPRSRRPRLWLGRSEATITDADESSRERENLNQPAPPEKVGA